MPGRPDHEIIGEAQAPVDHLLSQYQIVTQALSEAEAEGRCALCDRPLDQPGQPFSTAVGRDCRRCHLLCNRRSPDRILICGLPGMGKSSLDEALAEVIPSAVVFNADEVRSRLWPELGYSPADRLTQARRMAALANMSVISGCSAICAFVAPTQEARDPQPWGQTTPGVESIREISRPKIRESSNQVKTILGLSQLSRCPTTTTANFDSIFDW